MSFYTEMASVANDLLSEYGQPVTLMHHQAGVYDPSLGTVAIANAIETAVGAVFDYKSSEIDGTLIQRGDKKLLISVTGITEPKLNDSVTIGAKTYVIKSINEINPAGTVVMYQCQIR